MNWYLEVLKKYAVFDGRSRRKEYWFFVLFNILVSMVILMIGGVLVAIGGHADDPATIGPKLALIYGLYALYSLAVLLPGLGVSIRRLHDTGRSGWLLLLAFVPFVGGIILLVFMFQDSQPGPNQYGPNPKGIAGVSGFSPVAPGYGS